MVLLESVGRVDLRIDRRIFESSLEPRSRMRKGAEVHSSTLVIICFHNHKRLHQAPGYQTPIQTLAFSYVSN